MAHDELAVRGGVDVELDGVAPAARRVRMANRVDDGPLPGSALVGVGEDAAFEPGVRIGTRMVPTPGPAAGLASTPP